MKKLGSVSGASAGDFAPIIGAEVLVDEEFIVTGARSVATQFGERIVFDVVWVGEPYALFLSPNIQRAAIRDHFQAENAESIGPVTLVKKEGKQGEWFAFVDPADRNDNEPEKTE
jgi:hypothetical protein